VDFILFDKRETFLCLVLKNMIKSRKPLLSAFCQTLHRTNLFVDPYNSEKMRKARKDCFNKLGSYRIRDIENGLIEFDFLEKSRVIPILAARDFTKTAESEVSG